MTRGAVPAELAQLPELDAEALRRFAPPRLDEWPARLRGIAAGPERPPAVVAPAGAAGVAAVLRWAAGSGARVQALGAGSNVVGAIDGTVDVLVSLERMAGVAELDPVSQTVTAGAGIDGRSLERHVQDHGFTLGHYPQSLHVSTLGGWIATRASGTYSALHGGIERLLVGAEVVQPCGDVVRVRPRPRPSGGLDLLGLLCGAEGSFGIVIEATVAVHRRWAETRVCGAFATVGAGLAAQRELVQRGIPLGLVRLYNAAETVAVSEPGATRLGECLLVATTAGPEPVADAAARAAEERILAAGGRIVAPAAADPWFARRYAGPGFMAERNAQPGRMFDTIEVALPWATAAACAEELEERLGLLSEPFHQHFSHVYPSGVCLYAILHLAGDDEDELHARWRTAWGTALDTAARHGGTLAHHHGIGALRAGRYRATPEGRVHAALSRAIDPDGVLAAPLLDTTDDLLGAAASHA